MHTPRRRFSERRVKGGTSKELASLAPMFNTLSKKYKACARTKHFLWCLEYGAEAFFLCAPYCPENVWLIKCCRKSVFLTFLIYFWSLFQSDARFPPEAEALGGTA